MDGERDGSGRGPTLGEARALAHPMRIRILRLCLDRARTNAELAAALGERPATVLHHVRTLVAAGFLAEEGWRTGPKGAAEKPYRATGKSWRLNGALGGGDPAVLHAAFAATAAEISEAGSDAVVEGARMAIRLTPSQLDTLAGGIRELIAGLGGPDAYLSPDPPAGDPYALLVVLHRRRLPEEP